MEKFWKKLWKKLCTTKHIVTGKIYWSPKVGIAKVIIMALLLIFFLTVITSCGTVDRIVSTSEKIIQGEVYYQTRKGKVKIEKAALDAQKKLEKRERKIDKRLKEFEIQLDDQWKKKRNNPIKNKPPIRKGCEEEVTLFGVKKECNK